MPDLSDLFDRVVCINLDRRPDRWERFRRHIDHSDWPFAEIERFAAIDGSIVPAPSWWRAGAGAWGCHQTHVRVMQEAIQDEIDSLLIMEDDAVLCDEFAERAAVFADRVPDDWDGLMLGGQHLMPPEIVGPGVFRVRNGNRTHAYALRGELLKEAYKHLCDYPAHARRPRQHVDHRLGVLHESGRFMVYAPDPWLVGQAGGDSDVSGKYCADRSWHI